MRQSVVRMVHHPSIVAWSGCNECGGIGSLLDIIASEDTSRAIRAASPASGFSKGVFTLTGLPTGALLVGGHGGKPPPGLPWPVGESHGPYGKAASSMLTVNFNGPLRPPPAPKSAGSDNPSVTVQQRHPIGPAVPGYFVSETGCTTMSSFESMAGTLRSAFGSLMRRG